MRDYAEAIADLVRPLVLPSMEAFDDSQMNGMTLSALEVRALSTHLRVQADGPPASDKKRELAELARLCSSRRLSERVLFLSSLSVF